MTDGDEKLRELVKKHFGCNNPEGLCDVLAPEHSGLCVIDKRDLAHTIARAAYALGYEAAKGAAMVCAECLGSGGVVRANGEHHDGATSSYETATCPTCSGRGLTFGQGG